MPVGVAGVLRARPGAKRGRQSRQGAQRAYVVPVAVVLGQIPESLVWIEQQVFRPAVLLAAGVDRALLIADHFANRPPPASAASQRNEQRETRFGCKLLKDLQVGIFRIQDREALRTDHVE